MGITVNSYSWSSDTRVQFCINQEVVAGSEATPFVFKLSSDLGITGYDISYIFGALSNGSTSVVNRKKVLFSQLVGTEEVPIFAELDSWDHQNSLAIFWVSPIELSSTHTNIFYFYYDKTKPDNIQYLSETNETSISLFRDKGVEGTYDTTSILPGEILKVGNKFKMWPCGNTSKWGMLYCESTDLIIWTRHQQAFDWSHTYDSEGHLPGTVIYENGLYQQWYSGYNGTNWQIMYCESLDGLAWTDFQLVVPYNVTAYSDRHTLRCAVVKEHGAYKMWYSAYISSPDESRIMYCESEDGKSWKNHQISIDIFDVPEAAKYLRPSKVNYKDGRYTLFFELHTGSYWVGYYAESYNGIAWENLSRWAVPNTLGEYDTVSAGLTFYSVEHEGFYYCYYGVYSTYWAIVLVKTVSLKGPRTPSQEVWSNKFFSVHHLNSTYNYIDSTSNRLDISSLSNTLPVPSNVGSSALELLNKDSYINLGGGSKYIMENDVCVYVFSNLTDGGNLVSSTYNLKSIHCYYQEEISNTPTINENFTGDDGDNLHPLRWSTNDYIKIYNNQLRVMLAPYDEVPGKGQTITSLYSLVGDFDIQIDFTSTSLDNISEHSKMIYLSFTSTLDSSAYIFLGIGINNGVKYWTRRQNPGSYCCDDLFTTRSHPTGTIRIVREGTNVKWYYLDAGHPTWTQLRSATWVEHNAIVRVQSWRSSTNYDVHGSFDNLVLNSGTVNWDYNSLYENSLNMEYNTSEGVRLLSMLDRTVPNTWASHLIAHTDTTGANLSIRDDSSLELGIQVGSLTNTTQNLYIGGGANSVLGVVSEIWWSTSPITTPTYNFIDQMLKDNVLVVSTHYLEGYATEYNKAVSTTILAYDEVTKQLVGYTETDPENGYYYIETATHASCFLVAIDGNLYNHFILGKALPKYI